MKLALQFHHIRFWRSLFMSLVYGVIILTLFGWQTRQPTFSLLITALAIIIWMINTLIIPKQKKFQAPKTLLLYLVWIIISSFFSSYISNSLFELIRLIGSILIMIAVMNQWTDDVWRLFSSILTSIGIIASIIGIYDFFQLSQPFAGIAGSFGWRNTFAGWILLILPITLSLGINHIQREGRIINSLTSILLLTLLFLTFSQAAWLSFAAILIIFSFLEKPKKLFLKKLGFIFLGAGILTWSLIQLHPIITLRPKEVTPTNATLINAASITNRLAYWDGSLMIWREHPFFGVGLGNFKNFYPRAQNALWTFSNSPHNSLLLILTETGALGVILWIFFLGDVWKYLFLSWQKLKHADKNIVFMISLSLFASLLKSLFDFDWEVPAIAIIWWIQVGILLHYVMPQKKAASHSISSLILGSLLLFYVTSRAVGLWYLEQIKMMQEQSLDAALTEPILKKLPYLMPENADVWERQAFQSYLNILNHRGDRKEESYRLWNASRRSLYLDTENANRHHLYAKNLNLITDKKDPTATEIEKEFQRAIELDPLNHPEYYQALTEWYLRVAMGLKALKTVDQALAIYTEESIAQIFSDGKNMQTLREQKNQLEQLKNFILENWKELEKKNPQIQAVPQLERESP